MDINKYHNKDKVFKESLELFLENSFDFFDLPNKAVELLSNEITETITRKFYTDCAFRLDTGIGRNLEWEDEISEDDILRFLSYNVDLTRKHKIEFETVIITNKKPKATNYVSKHINFNPIIINLSEINADKTIEKINYAIENGQPINPLEIVYLPLYGSPSGKSVTELLDCSLKFTSNVVKDSKQKDKIFSLLFLLTATHVSKAELKKILEDNNMRIGHSPAIDIFMEWGEERGMLKKAVETAKNFLKMGLTVEQVAQGTELPIEEIEKLAKELQ